MHFDPRGSTSVTDSASEAVQVVAFGAIQLKWSSTFYLQIWSKAPPEIIHC